MRYQTWGDAFETFRTGEPAFPRVHGGSDFDWLGTGQVSPRSAMTSRSRTVLLESSIQPGDEPDASKLVDLQMLVTLGGRV
jgi:hypothetical protein